MKDIANKYKTQLMNFLNDLKSKNTRKKQIPNLLTFSRLFSPFIIIPLSLFKQFTLAGIFTALFSITDLFDGYIARKYNLVSEFGKDLDAITDKVFTGTIIIALSIVNRNILIFLFLELVIAVIGINDKLKNKNPYSSYIGKVKATFLYIYLVLIFCSIYVNINLIFIKIIAIITLILQLATIVNYLTRSIKLTKQNK